jgi:uncharacterized protein
MYAAHPKPRTSAPQLLQISFHELVHIFQTFFILFVYNCAYNRKMSYQWDDYKAAANLEKHGIDFADAVSVFLDDLSITVCDERFDEERFITIGLDVLGRVIVVVYTCLGNEVRLISARKATRPELSQYEER